MIFILIFFLIFSVMQPKTVLASDLDLTCNDSGCTPSPVTGYFPTDKWYPGKTIAKTFRIHNTSGSKKSAALGTYDESSTGGLTGVTTLTIESVPSGSTVWTGTFAEVFNNDEISLGEIDVLEIKEYRMLLAMDSSADNTRQDLSLSFSMKIGLLEPTQSPTATSVPPSLTPVPTSAQAAAASVFSRFVIRTDLNRTVVTIVPVLGIEEARITRPFAGGINPWMSPLFRGATCRLSYWGLIGFAVQMLLSWIFIKIYRRQNFQIIAIALALFMALTILFALKSTCFTFLPLFWLGLGIMSLSAYLVIYSRTSP